MAQLNLFGEEEVKEEKAKENTRSSSSKQQSKKTSSTPPKKKVEDIKVQSDWSIHYARATFSVEEFIEDIPEEGITLEHLRESMSQDFFEMSKDRTSWDHDKENKRLFPRVSGAAKGWV
ncbi:hypothetical protein V1503_24130 [Bacillus sp. SCS-151]|uniref:hypothetical protein n=1 Tax=Nanhaiella sioensis TaxID=3115293 RepID=UPI00397DF240